MYAANVSRSAFFFVALVCCSASGCVFPRMVAWLPDSSGFVYVARKDEQTNCLFHFDVATKKVREVAEFKDENTSLPAVSPDGKQFAVTSGNRIVLLNLDGKEVQKSQEIGWKADSGAPTTYLFWAGNGRYILCSRVMEVAVFDLKDEKMSVIKDCSPIPFGGSPIDPKSKGFLAFKFNRDIQTPLFDTVVFVDWSGIKTPIKMVVDDKQKPTCEVTLNFYSWQFRSYSRWEHDKAKCTGGDGELEIDVSTFTGRAKKAIADGGDRSLQFKMPGCDLKAMAEDNYYLTLLQSESKSGVVERKLLIDAEGQKLKLSGGFFGYKEGALLLSYEPTPTHGFHPSPDRKHLVLTCHGNLPIMHVLTSELKLVASFELGVEEYRKRLNEAVEECRKRIEKQEPAAAAMLKLAKQLLDDGDKMGAQEFLKKLIDRYPGTKAEAEAKELLKKLEKK